MAKKRKAPKGCYWVGDVLYGRTRIKGKLERIALGTDNPAVAVGRRKAWHESLIAGRVWGDDEKTFPQVVEVWEASYIAGDRSAGPNTVKRYKVSLGQIMPIIGDRPVKAVDAKLIREVVDARRAGGATNATLKRDLVALSSVMNCAVAREWIDANPVLPRMKAIVEKREPINLPRPADVERVIERVPGMLKQLVRAAIVTGCRLNELVTAKRADIDHERATLTVLGKRNKRRTIELAPMGGYELIRSLPVFAGSPYVFWHHDGKPYRNLSARFAWLVKETGELAAAEGVDFAPFCFHDLRHLHATHYLHQGIDNLWVLSKRLGHTSTKVTERYLHELSEVEAAAQIRKVQRRKAG
jgi:integrase/recombinase XerD